jgi:hypothetical protein
VGQLLGAGQELLAGVVGVEELLCHIVSGDFVEEVTAWAYRIC